MSDSINLRPTPSTEHVDSREGAQPPRGLPPPPLRLAAPRVSVVVLVAAGASFLLAGGLLGYVLGKAAVEQAPANKDVPGKRPTVEQAPAEKAANKDAPGKRPTVAVLRGSKNLVAYFAPALTRRLAQEAGLHVLAPGALPTPDGDVQLQAALATAREARVDVLVLVFTNLNNDITFDLVEVSSGVLLKSFRQLDNGPDAVINAAAPDIITRLKDYRP